MNKSGFFLLTCALFLLASVEPIMATRPTLWTVSQQSEFLEGELKGVSVTSDGKLILAPALEPLLETDAAFIYSAVAGRNGTLFAGTGNDGKVFRVPRNGEGGEWASVSEPGVHTLAVDSSGRVYAGSGPDGKVYRISSQGTAEVFFDPEEKYIWSLIFDRSDNLFVGTGPTGVVYKVTPEGEDSIFYDSSQTHIPPPQLDLEVSLLAGTTPGGLLMRLSDQGRPFVIYDSPLSEIKAITTDRYGTLYAVGLSTPSQKEGDSTQGQEGANSETPSGQPGGTRNNGGELLEVSGTTRGSGLEIYRISRDGLVEVLYSSNDETAFDLLVRSNGNLLVATGNKGRIISISPTKFTTFLTQSSQQQVTSLLESEGEVYTATSNLGSLLHLSTLPSQVGVYESKVLDARMLTSWGRIRWKRTGPQTQEVRVFTRVGNTEVPDQTWTDWNGPLTDSQGTPIESPATRFLQWKMEFPKGEVSTALSADQTGIDSVTVSFLQQNMPPQVTSITIHPPGMALTQQALPNPTGASLPGGPDQAHLRSLPRRIRNLANTVPRVGPRAIYSPGARSFSWTAADPNGDDLTYSIHYRLEGDQSWQLLGEDLADGYYTLDGLSFSSGTFLVKVQASDSVSNPPDKALQGELISAPFVIANSSPLVQLEGWDAEGGSTPRLPFTARTSGSVVFQTEYSIDSGDWNILFPEDGIADSDLENYSLEINGIEPGRHSISIRVVDSIGNIGTSRTTIEVE